MEQPFLFDAPASSVPLESIPPPALVVPADQQIDDVTDALAPADAVTTSQPEPPSVVVTVPEDADLPTAPADFALFGQNLFGDAIEPPSHGKLSDKFIVPPFTVLDARQGYWQDRKRAWISLGIKSEVGRGDNLLSLSDSTKEYFNDNKAYLSRLAPGGSPMPAADYSKRERGDGAGKPLDGSKSTELDPGSAVASGTSIFDPVLCELTYRWFCPLGGLVLDPFAGGSVRGIVAALLDRNYIGIDLSSGQAVANREQAERLCKGNKPTWIVGDSRTVDIDLPAGADLVFSCPPYGDLEVYSDNPLDLSSMTHDAFLVSYREIIARVVANLKMDRFACFVVGDFRDEKGLYRKFVGSTIDAFESAGCRYYNEAILVTSVGSLPIRVSKMFNSTRKLGKTHQNYLVFVKGDGRRAAEACNGQLELPG